MKQLSNPFSTGGGGPIFESRVQAAFAALLLAKGVCPCLPPWPIYKVKLQGKYSGYETDDLIVFARHDSSHQEAKLIIQIKHAPSITKKDVIFGEVIRSAWSDFNNPAVFQHGYDAIALITGPLTATNTYDVRDLLEWAKDSENATDFFKKVRLANFSNPGKRDKLKVFQYHLTNANHGQALDDKSTWQFLRRFHLLGFDLDIKAGVSVSLMQSLLSVVSSDDVEKVWLKIINEVQSWNPRAGTMTLECLPQDLLDCFRIILPPQLPTTTITPIREAIAATLLGGWSENADGDKRVIEQFTGTPFTSWQDRIRDAWLTSPGTFEQRNGEWKVSHRRALWDSEGPRISDALLDRFKHVAVTILREKDPALELKRDDRW